MTDLPMSVLISRTLLGLADLEINDFVNYYVAPQFLGAINEWDRVQATSAYVDGAATVQRKLQMVQEQVVVEVMGGDSAELQDNCVAITEAFTQDNFTMTVTIDGIVKVYACEAAGYQLAWTGPRLIEHQGQLTFTMPRQPNLLNAVVV